MVTKKARKSRKNHILTLGVVVILLILGFFGIQKFLLWQKLQASISCNDPSSIKNFITTAWGNPTNIKDISKDYSLSNQPIFLLENKNSPYIFLQGNLISYDQFSSSKESVVKFYQEKLMPKIQKSGYMLDVLSSQPGKSDVVEIKTQTDLFMDKNSYLSVEYGLSTNMQGHELPSISVVCLKKNPEQLALTKQLLASPSMQVEIVKELPYVQNMQNQLRFGIIEQNGGVVQADIGNRYGGGSGVWFGKDGNGNWKVIYTGQQSPPCALLESYGALKGMSCTDPADPNNLNSVTK